MADGSPSLSQLSDDERKETSAVRRLTEAAQDSVMGRCSRFALKEREGAGGGGGMMLKFRND